MLIHYLIVTEPDTAIVIGKSHYVVYEGLRFGVVLRGVESMDEHLLQQLKVRLGIETFIER